MASIHEERAKVFKAFGDERRLAVLELLQSGEQCANSITETLGIPQSTLSYHMRMLCESEVVQAREEGKWTYYSISQEGAEKAIALFKEMTALKAGAKKTAKGTKTPKAAKASKPKPDKPAEPVEPPKPAEHEAPSQPIIKNKPLETWML
ncbi:MAG: metalloregulator ArsR/SmtB family transcription factor [Clostridia bacterium]|nr:metalloregulator ArsR/SmtB family transcription factor [Clostridia bacterium]